MNRANQPTDPEHKNNITDVIVLATMVTQLTSVLTKQGEVMTKYHEEVVKILEKQSQMLYKLMKNQVKKSKNKANSPSSSPVNSSSTSSTTLSPVSPAGLGLSPDWDYSSSSGHDSWFSNYPICGEENQSPINLETVDVALREQKKPLQFTSYDKVNSDTCKLVNTGNSVSLLLTSSPNPTMSGGPLNTTSYNFNQAVFHWGSNDTFGSEHTIRNIRYPMEMQLIHHSTSLEEPKLAIASFLFEICQHDNPFLAPIIAKLANIKVAGTEVALNSTKSANEITSLTTVNEVSVLDSVGNPEAMVSFSLDHLMQDSISGPYFSYKGSLTFPPCSIVEQWMVFRTPLDISITQLEQFRTLLKKDGSRIDDNFRPVQPLGKRILAFTM